MVEKRLSDTFAIVNERGLHARAASAFVNVASRYQCAIKVGNGERDVDGRSILGIISLVGIRGTQIVVTAEGDDAPDAIDALRDLVRQGFQDQPK